MLGSGGYGQVYKVQKVVGGAILPKTYAMKTENVVGSRTAMRLKIEVMVLEECLKQPTERRKHFVEYFEKGATALFKWVVMELIGPSLDSVRQQLRQNFSLPTALHCGLQTLQAMCDLHAVGFLHRDVKPANFCIGLEEKEKFVFILDFGIARKYIYNGALRNARNRTKFIGTQRFCPRASHLMQEQGRKDDVESWLFMLFDLVDNDKGIPWKGMQKDAVLNLKQAIFADSASSATKHSEHIPKQFANIAAYIDKLKFDCEPDYTYIKNVITMAAAELKVDLAGKLDWEGGVNKPAEEKSKPKESEKENESAKNSPESESDGTRTKGSLSYMSKRDSVMERPKNATKKKSRTIASNTNR